MNTKNPLRREIRNGKVVYIPKKNSQKNLSLSFLSTRHSNPLLGMLPLTVGVGAIATTLWFSAQYLINPDVAFWADNFIFGVHSRSNSQARKPKSLEAIEDKIRQAGQQVGPVLTLKTQFGFHQGLNTPETLLIPVLDKRSENCPACQSIVELRQYRALQLPLIMRLFQTQPLFRLTQKIPVQGPSESDLVSLEQNPLLSMGSEQSLPLTQVEQYDLAPKPGLWLRLTGLRPQGNGTATYGQVFYYSPERDHLSLMLNWVSPPGDFPQWQEITGDAKPELVINQTVGSEPQYTVYQLQTNDGEASQLKPIQLDVAVLDNADYRYGLRLARSGLWSEALEYLNRAKTTTSQWKPEAQAQLDVVNLHAKITQFQAQQPSTSTGQRILGYLVNGSWKPALQVFQSDKAASLEVKEMLAADSGRLQNRVTTALSIQPSDPEAIVWGALLKQARRSTGEATTWAQQQAKGNSTTLKLVQQALQQMEKAEQASNAAPSAKQTPSAKSSPQGKGAKSPPQEATPTQKRQP